MAEVAAFDIRVWRIVFVARYFLIMKIKSEYRVEYVCVFVHAS